MPAPSPLHIATQSVQRLLKEETYYKKELSQQEERVRKLAESKTGGSDEDGNAEFVLKQEQKAVEETRAVFAPLRQRIEEAVDKLEEQIAVAESSGAAKAEELTKAKEILEAGKAKEE